MSVALGTVFILNSIALFIFPMIGHRLGMTQPQFGVWAAIAIHDTSSVVGAAAKYGAEALQIATTVKLTRALWIVPAHARHRVLLQTQIGEGDDPLVHPLVRRRLGAPHLRRRRRRGLVDADDARAHRPDHHALPDRRRPLAQIDRRRRRAPAILGILLWIAISSVSLFAVLRTV